MQKTVIRDVNGTCINIGEWDYMEVVETDASGKESVLIQNPLPDGATSSVEEIVTLPDGGLSATS